MTLSLLVAWCLQPVHVAHAAQLLPDSISIRVFLRRFLVSASIVNLKTAITFKTLLLSKEMILEEYFMGGVEPD